LVRENRFWGGVLPLEEGAMIAKHIKSDHHIDLRLEEELDEIIEGENGRVSAILTKKGERIDCELLGLTAGVKPNIDFLKNTELEIGKGIRVNKYLETNQPNVYAAGDCAEMKETVPGRRPIEAVWYVGRMMGETLGQTLSGNKIAYEPGIWFNSAKFFDIEYQTYGNVSSTNQEGESTFYWQHPSKPISFRAVYDSETKALKGINNFGIRLRHKICDKWIKSQTSVYKVMAELRDANFDPEFYKQYEKDIVSQFNKENGTSIKPKKKNLLAIFGRG
jgi:NADPH-dependent 2,4-dienoyl-CoA reductase/sulfur reductase-like enzyme